MFNTRLIRKIWETSIYHVYISIAMFFLSLILIFLTMVTLPSEISLFDVAIIGIYFMFSIPAAVVGFFTSKDVSTRAGLGYGLSNFTVLLLYMAIGEHCYFRIGYILCILSLGIISTWAGSLVGEVFQKKYKLGLKKAFIIIYVFYIFLMLRIPLTCP